jgi:putative ABC transport system permease protein
MRRLAPRWRALTGSASAAAAALGLLACLCTLLAVVGPRSGAQLRTSAYRGLINAAPAMDKTIVGTVDYSALSGAQGLNAATVLATKVALRGQLQSLPLAPARADWSTVTTPALGLADSAPGAQAALPPRVELSYQDTLTRNVRVIAGRLPAGRPGTGTTAVVQAAVTQPTARQFGLEIGTKVAVPSADIVLRVTAIVQPTDSAAPFWTADPTLAKPEFVEVKPSVGYYLAGVFIAPGALPALLGRVNTGTTMVTLTYPLALGNLTAAQATQLWSALAGAMTTAGYLTGLLPQPVTIALTSDAVALISSFESESAAVGSVLDLFSVSLAVLAAVVVLLGGWLLAERRRQDFAVLRARGASRRQLALLALAVSGATTLPGALVGAAIAVALTLHAPVALSWWLAGLVVLAALAGPVLVTVRTHRGYAAVVRPDAPPARLSAVRRLVVEATLLAGAVGGLAVLRYQGSRAAGDFYASAAPVLLAVGVAVVVLRVYPLLVRGVLRLTGKRVGPATFLGLARAVRVSASATLPAFAMVLALALVSFAGMVGAAVLRGEVAASWQQAGADAVITGTGPVTAALERSVAAVPGVRSVAPVAAGTGTTANLSAFSVLLVDPAQYAGLVAGSPLPPVPAAFTAGSARPGSAGLVPVLASPGLAVQLGHGPVSALIDDQPLTVRVVGQAASMSAIASIGGGLGYLVVNQEVAGSAAHRRLAAEAPNTLMLAGQSINQAALRAVVARYGAGAKIFLRSQLLGGLEGAPLQRGAYVALVLGAGAAGCCCLLVLLLSLLLSAAGRRLALARMSTMGLSVGQGRLLGLVELLPQLVAVLAGGLGCAVALVPLIGPALSLTVFTGSASSVAVEVEPVWLVLAGAGLVVLAVVVVAGQAVLSDRTAARSLRMGE